MATRFRSPLYANLAIYLDGRRVRARGGFFDIESADTAKALRKFAREHKHYQIEEVGKAPEPKTTGHGVVRQSPGISKAERHPEIVQTPSDDDSDAVDEAIDAADDEADGDEDDLEDEDS